MKVALHTTAYDAVLQPWLRSALTLARVERRPVAVVVPFRSDAYLLKAQALSAGIGLFGIHFVTPGELRDRLARHLGIAARVPIREHLHLLLASAAERRGDAAAGVAAAPDRLLKAIDLLSSGGWDFAEAGPPALRAVVADFEKLVERAGFQLMHAADRVVLDRARNAPPHFAALFITGFDAMHWPLWPLLAAAVHSSESATVCLSDPRFEAEALDATWIGTWEESFGPATPVDADDAARPVVNVLRLPESKGDLAQRQREPASAIEFLVGHDTAEHARAVVTKALQFLADPACERLGILFPAAGALSRRVAALLAEHGVPHNDGLAHHAPGPLEDAAWPAWLELQESPRIPALLRFLRVHHAPDHLFGGLPLAELEDALPRVFTDLLIDDLAVVAEYLAQHPRKRHAAALAAGIRALPFLPERATLAEFIGQSGAIFHALGWDARAGELSRLATDWRDTLALALSRRTWLRWLRETLVSWSAVRAESGNHPYSRVHLLPCAQGGSRTWSHLIAAGLNDGQWPPPFEDAGFIGEDEIDALNRRVRTLNERATAQGRQGEGHSIAAPGKTLCLGPAQRRDLALRQFLNTLESATVAIAASAQLFDEAAPDRRLNPSDFFTRLYFCARGRAVSQDAMLALRAETNRWIEAGGLWQSRAADTASVRQTRIAFDARRAPAQKFGEYEFALRTPLAPLRLSATDWEKALSSPALVWMRRLLGVVASDESDETPWSLAAGQWVHAWLRAISDAEGPNAFARLPPPERIAARVLDRALAFRERVGAILRTCERTAPEWWLSAWQQALHVAERLARRIAAVEGRAHLATEWKFDDTAIPVGESAALHVHGRVDLILTTSPGIEDAWIVDFKTGSRKALSAKTLSGGDGLQLALYTLALHQRGAGEVGASVLTPDLELTAPQLMLADFTALPALWRGLLEMQERGVFGMLGPLRSEFSFHANHPLATLAIDEEVLEEKWALTHPDLANDA